MGKNRDRDIFISDDGVETSKKRLYSNTFIFLCNVISVVLVILGILAFVEGNF